MVTAHGSIDSRRTDPQVLSGKLLRKPTSVDMRNAAAVALSISELVRESEVHVREALWTVEVPEDPAELSRRAGASFDETEDAVRLLVAAEVVSRVGLTGSAHLRVGEAMFAEEPVLAQVAWEEVRERLAAVRASVTPALAVVRELARSTRLADTKTAGSSWASVTLARFVDLTLFQRTAVSKAISALREAGVIERGQPRGHEGQYRLLPVAFGFAAAPLDDGSAVPAPSDRPRGATEVAVSPSRASAAPVVPPSTQAVGSGPLVHVGGIPEVPPGVSLRVELDAEGRQYVHIGPHVAIGPL